MITYSLQEHDSVVAPLLAGALSHALDDWLALKQCRDADALPVLRDVFLGRSRVRLPSYESLLHANATRTDGGGCQSAESVR